MVIDLGSDPDFFQLDDMLVPARFSLLATLLVPELAIVHEPANGWNRIRRNFHEIEPSLSGHLQRISGWNDSDLLAFLVDESNFPNSDPLIDTCLNWSGYSSPPIFSGY